MRHTIKIGDELFLELAGGQSFVVEQMDVYFNKPPVLIVKHASELLKESTQETHTNGVTMGYIKPRPTMLGKEEIENRFGFHKATVEGENATLPKHSKLRILFRELAEELDELIPNGRAKSVAFTELENASMWAHKAVAEGAPLIEESQTRSGS